jgi:hypothetical protein
MTFIRFHRFHLVKQRRSEEVMLMLFLCGTAFDLQMIEAVVSRIRANNMRARVRIQRHQGSRVDRQGVGQSFLFELDEWVLKH